LAVFGAKEEDTMAGKGTAIETAESVVTRTAEVTVTGTVASTKNGIKWTDEDLMFECKEGGWTRRYL
jgi:hypothetical protein